MKSLFDYINEEMMYTPTIKMSDIYKNYWKEKKIARMRARLERRYRKKHPMMEGEEIDEEAATPANTMGMGNPSPETEPLVDGKCKGKCKKKKCKKEEEE